MIETFKLCVYTDLAHTGDKKEKKKQKKNASLAEGPWSRCWFNNCTVIELCPS